MSQTWVIKDTAPVDKTSLTLATTNISFTTNNQKATSIGIDDQGVVYVLVYGGIGDVAGHAPGLDPVFVWDNEAYKTLEFDTAPTGELLAWLQKNATLKVPGINYQDIHLEDKALWNQLQTAWEQGDYTAALNVLKNASLTDKQLNAAAINALTTELLSLQAQSDPSFKTGQIVVASEPPSDLAVGKVYFRLIGPVTDYNEQTAYYIEINQKTSSGYDVLDVEVQANKIYLTYDTAKEFGMAGMNYSLDAALYNVKTILDALSGN